ncbi:hypothetical protein ND748_07785 [Frankia sp. AiPs1]|uniref:hypothetical protein n=1 Tax=Frankia sp. AiPs1 TaxID=573493 RepID=UPI0020438701|nr:hypothetical protein [Frankia sp. AiPs1]MCM3921565.1 hypothetical protein [Frankia sp. AiPs1]
MSRPDPVPAAYLADPAPVKITAPGGWWRLRPTLGPLGPRTVTAELFHEMKAPVLQIQARLEELDGHLTFPLTQQMHDQLRRAAPQPHFVAVYAMLTPAHVAGDARLRPWRASRVDLAAMAPTTYGRLLHGDPPLRTWQNPDGNVRIDITAATAARAEPSADPTLVVAYRIYHEGLVVLSGRSVTVPGHIDPSSDAALRAVVADLSSLRSIAITERQHRFLDASGHLADAVADTAPRAGSRIAIKGPPGLPGATGTVRMVIPSRGGEHYLWRPDVADLPGHPWRGQQSRLIDTPVEHARPVLTAKDTGVGTPTAPAHLTYGALIATIDDADTPGGVVLRAFPTREDLIYEFQPAQAGEYPRRISASDVVPVSGTAWPDLQTLLAARGAANLPLVVGEHLLTLREAAPVVDRLRGPTVGPITAVETQGPALDPDILSSPDPPLDIQAEPLPVLDL